MDIWEDKKRKEGGGEGGGGEEGEYSGIGRFPPGMHCVPTDSMVNLALLQLLFPVRKANPGSWLSPCLCLCLWPLPPS